MSQMGELVLPAVNLGILVGVLTYFLREPLKAFVRDRHHHVSSEMVRVRELLAQAQKRHQEFTSKLHGFEAEAVALRQQMKADAESARNRIVDESKRLASTIVHDARISATAVFGDLKARMYTLFGTRVLDRAEELLRERLTGEDRARIRQEFSRQVETVQ